MATRLGNAVDRLREHMKSSMADGSDVARGDALLRGILQVVQDPGEEADDEEERRDFMVPGEDSLARSSGDYRKTSMGLDGLALDGRTPPRRTSSALSSVLKGVQPPRRAGTVR